jgi:hypothetical protein
LVAAKRVAGEREAKKDGREPAGLVPAAPLLVATGGGRRQGPRARSFAALRKKARGKNEK